MAPCLSCMHRDTHTVRTEGSLTFRARTKLIFLDCRVAFHDALAAQSFVCSAKAQVCIFMKSQGWDQREIAETTFCSFVATLFVQQGAVCVYS
jgi:hypothetical protein